jgi:hypothetical protein
LPKTPDAGLSDLISSNSESLPMLEVFSVRLFRRGVRTAVNGPVVLGCLVALLGSTLAARGQSATNELRIRTAPRAASVSSRKTPVNPGPATQHQVVEQPRSVQLPSRTRIAPPHFSLQNPHYRQPGKIPQAHTISQPVTIPQIGTTPDGTQPVGPPQPASSKDPCAAMTQTPLVQLGINIGPTEGVLPTNHAETCWEPFNQAAGAFAGERCWGPSHYHWDATCLCHRPLYFEEINLERYGYGCPECIQPAASAAHFFATVPALPYCMAVECPCECVYTLGHYRPGSCPPWRWHWPPCEIPATATEAAVLAALILIFP